MTELKMIENLERFLDKLPTDEVKVQVVQRYIRHLKMEQRVINLSQERKSEEEDRK